MSAPSTPRSTRDMSPDHGHHEVEQDSPAVLTPGRKIKAMLAQFDSGSESENDDSHAKQPKHGPTISLPSQASPSKAGIRSSHIEDETDDEDDVVFAPRGRLAARMQIQPDDHTGLDSASSQGHKSAYERVAKELHAPLHDSRPAHTDHAALVVNDLSDDDLPAAPYRRRLLSKHSVTERRSPTDDEDSTPRPSSQSRSDLNAVNEPDSETRTGPENRGDQDRTHEPKNARMLALVEQKRKENEERERAEAEKKAARAAKAEQFSSDILLGEDSDDDPESARKLTQQSRPARKASKKALEEMNKETQRMSRNMQLTHEARTKRKITKESFLARFAFGDNQDSPTNNTANNKDLSTSSESAPSSDGEINKDKVTPPTSPVQITFDEEAKQPTSLKSGENENLLPTSGQLRSEIDQPRPQTITLQQATTSKEQTESGVDTGKKHMPRTELTIPPVRVLVSREKVAEYQRHASDDDDLDVITSPGRCRRLAAFENLPARNAQEDKLTLKLKLLAHLTSPTRRSKSMTPAELGASLRLQARKQALQERQARIEELRAKGVVIETSEEREAMEADVEELLEKARKEAIEIARRERAAQGEKPAGEDDDEDDDEEDDEDYLSSSEEENVDGVSGDIEDDDEDEDEEEEDEEDEEDENEIENDEAQEGQGKDSNAEVMIDNEASDALETDGEQSDVASSDDENENFKVNRIRRQRRIVSDDEDGDDDTLNPQETKTPTRSIPPSLGSAQRPHFPGMPETSSFGMSLTQAFAGTLAEDQSDNEQDSFTVIKSLPDPGLGSTRTFEVDSQVMVRDSQEQRRESIDLLAGFTQSDARVSESPAPSQFPEPTQDIGFVLSPFDPTKRFLDPPASTVDTVLISQSESPIAQRRRLHRGKNSEPSDEEHDSFEIKASAFDVMKKASKHKTAVPFDKMKSNARDHVDEAAEESEDEYAGLGGASDDDDGEENEYDREMINDDSGEVVDEKELAALNANHQRAMDEKQVSKLLKDITTGALRRRRGGDDDLDLDDSDDERMARRRAKQREFAKMRQALLADEKVNEIANDPKKVAFFKALEDRDDDEMDLEFENDVIFKGDSSQEVQVETGHTRSTELPSSESANKRKRPLEASTDDSTNRPPPNLRRTAAPVSRKPSSLTEIRETLSFLTETPEYDSFREDTSVEEEVVYNTDKESEDGDTSQENNSSANGFAIPPNPRRTRGRVVDRLALLRAASSNSAPGGGTKSAFMSNTSSDVLPKVGFRPPPLLRRSTTASSSTTSVSSSSGSTSSRTTTTANPAAPGTKKGAVNYYAAARERERERELRLKERNGASRTTSLLKERAMHGRLGTLTRNQWE